MSFNGETVAEGERGHRRGVVLGFTLAELMLLLLFCLLLVSAGVAIQKDKEIAALKATTAAPGLTAGKLLDLETAQLRLGKLLAALFPAGVPTMSGPEVDKLWQQLVLAKNAQDAAEADPALAAKLAALKAAGLLDKSPEELAALGKRAPLSPGNAAWPPIITLGDSDYRFGTGSALITADFSGKLEGEVADKVAALLKQYDADVVEIIGHTDEQKIYPSRAGNLDTEAIAAVQGKFPTDGLIPLDNAGLGLARAVAVANILRDSGKLGSAKLVPMSAAQLVLPGDVLSDGSQSGQDPGRRRIEIRVRRTTASTP